MGLVLCCGVWGLRYMCDGAVRAPCSCGEGAIGAFFCVGCIMGCLGPAGGGDSKSSQCVLPVSVKLYVWLPGCDR